ncbi:MAG: RNA polymerase sigma factor [Bacteroidales bacterium]|jgi:RNA polymerase sigma factor (sigma-70 family)|nr:RNA polymerase sigma factor [Bacteroidales bacterium]
MKVEKEHKGLKSFVSSEYKNLVSYVRRYFNENYYDVSAEDIVQDVAVNIFSKLDIDKQVENIAGYVYRSIRNRITDFQRKSKKEVPFENFVNDEGEEYISENIHEEFDIPFETIDDEQFYKTFYEALNQLSPNQQMVFVATEIDGCTFDELSDELNIPIGTLLSWKHRGVKKLKELIKLDDFYNENEDKLI